MSLGNTSSSWALQIGETVKSQNMRIIHRLLSLQIEQSISPVFEVSLQLNERRDILVVHSQMIKKCYGLLTLHTGLDALVSNVECMSLKAILRNIGHSK